MEELRQEYWNIVRPELRAHQEMLTKGLESFEQTIEFNKTSMEGMHKWLLATLVAINGGAAISIGNMAQDHLSDLRASLSILVSGVIFAVLSGILQNSLWNSIVGLKDKLREVKDIAAAMADSEEITKVPKEIWKKDIKFNENRIKGLLVIRWIGTMGFFYLSLGCFIFGVYSAGAALT